MFTKIIVPLDGTKEAATALPVARMLANAYGAPVSLIRVVRRPAGLFAPHADEVRDAAAYLDKVAEEERGSSGVLISTHVFSGDASAAIIDQIEDSGSNAIVMATRGHGGVLRAVLGSVSSELLSKSTAPLVLLRADSRPVDAVRNILVPIDGTPESARAVDAAANLASTTGAHLLLLQVVTPTPGWIAERTASYDLGLYVDPHWDDASLAAARQHVEDVASRLTLQGVSADGLALEGDVSRTIARTAAATRVDLIVMFTRAKTGHARAVLGSIADAVVRLAPVPVLLLRSGGATLPRAQALARTDRESPQGTLSHDMAEV